MNADEQATRAVHLGAADQHRLAHVLVRELRAAVDRGADPLGVRAAALRMLGDGDEANDGTKGSRHPLDPPTLARHDSRAEQDDAKELGKSCPPGPSRTEERDEAPLILSAVLDAPVQHRLDALRRAYFPPERNHLDAHVTLFHHLPGTEQGAVVEALAGAVRRPAPPVEVTGVRSLGRGVAVVLVSPELAALRAGLARTFAPWLTGQDRTKRDLHVTVQNKVAPETARALRAELAATVQPERTRAVALALWRYRGGPWEPVARFTFDGEETTPQGGCES